MNELILKINDFKEKIALDINEAGLPADILKMILQDFTTVLTSLAQQQLQIAKSSQKEDEN